LVQQAQRLQVTAVTVVLDKQAELPVLPVVEMQVADSRVMVDFMAVVAVLALLDSEQVMATVDAVQFVLPGETTWDSQLPRSIH
jgi:hypothetical protein